MPSLVAVQRKQDPAEALQWQGDLASLQAWLDRGIGGLPLLLRPWPDLTLYLPPAQERLVVGDWLIRAPDGTYSICPHADYVRLYEPVVIKGR